MSRLRTRAPRGRVDVKGAGAAGRRAEPAGGCRATVGRGLGRATNRASGTV